MRLILVLTIYSLLATVGLPQTDDKESNRITSWEVEVLTYDRDYFGGRKGKKLFLKATSAGIVSLDVEKHDEPRRDVVVDKQELAALFELVNSREFESVNSKFEPLILLRDEIYVIELNVKVGKSSRKLIVKNYMASHPKAAQYYPAQLVKVLREVERLRELAGECPDGHLSLPY